MAWGVLLGKTEVLTVREVAEGKVPGGKKGRLYGKPLFYSPEKKFPRGGHFSLEGTLATVGTCHCGHQRFLKEKKRLCGEENGHRTNYRTKVGKMSA